MKIYLAGPDIFKENGKAIGEYLKRVCARHGHEGMYPFDNDFEKPLDSKLIFESDFNMVKECDVVLANMTRFRGPSMDVGTAWEIGAAFALGKKVLLYNNDGLTYSKAVDSHIYWKKEFDKFPNIEDFELPDNLMLIHGSHGVYDSIEDALNELEEVYND